MRVDILIAKHFTWLEHLVGLRVFLPSRCPPAVLKYGSCQPQPTHAVGGRNEQSYVIMFKPGLPATIFCLLHELLPVLLLKMEEFWLFVLTRCKFCQLCLLNGLGRLVQIPLFLQNLNFRLLIFILRKIVILNEEKILLRVVRRPRIRLTELQFSLTVNPVS